jgi:hypothetical protein
MIRTACALALAMLPLSGAARAGDYDWEDMFAPYRQRIDTATTSSGNAHNVNAATHMVTPWPRYVRNRRIPGNGARLAGAVKRYQEPQAQSEGQSGPEQFLQNLLKPIGAAANSALSSGGGTPQSAPSGQSK